jgi:hypothetical protein
VKLPGRLAAGTGPDRGVLDCRHETTFVPYGARRARRCDRGRVYARQVRDHSTFPPAEPDAVDGGVDGRGRSRSHGRADGACEVRVNRPTDIKVPKKSGVEAVRVTRIMGGGGANLSATRSTTS